MATRKKAGLPIEEDPKDILKKPTDPPPTPDGNTTTHEEVLVNRLNGQPLKEDVLVNRIDGQPRKEDVLVRLGDPPVGGASGDGGTTGTTTVTPTTPTATTPTNQAGTTATPTTGATATTDNANGGTTLPDNLVEVSDEEWGNWDEDEETMKANPPMPSTFRYFKRNKATGAKEVWESPGKGKRGKKVGDYDPDTGGIKNYVDPAVEQEERKARENAEKDKAAHEQKVYGNGIVDNANSQVSAVTSGEDKPDMYRMKLQQMIDELDARHNARMKENDNDLRRSQRNRLMTAIGDGLNAMHRAYTHSRGIQPMPGSERQMSKEWQDRYDRLKAERDRLNKDYLAEQLRIMQHGTAQQRADAYKDWMTRQGDAKQKNAATNAKKAEDAAKAAAAKAESDRKAAEAREEKLRTENEILKEELDRIRHGLPKNPPAPRSSSGGGGGKTVGGKQQKYDPSKDPNMRKVVTKDRRTGQTTTEWVPVNGGGSGNGSGNKPQRGSKKTNVTWATRPK